MKPRVAPLVLWSTLALLPWSGSAAAIDVALVLDRSGSMKANDPRRDSVRGVELFAELLDPKDRLAFLTFAERSETLAPMTLLADAKARARLARLAGSVPMTGALTDFAAALRQAYDAQSGPLRDPGAERIVVLFSDGKLDLGSEAANQAARAAIASELLPRFQAADIRVYGVAFSPKADLDFLRGLAEATGGQAFRADKPEDIYGAFVRLFEEADQPLTAPFKDDRVAVDGKVRELKLLVGRDSASAPIRLTDPLSKEIKEQDRLPGVEWKRTPRFDHITIQQPEPGSWKVMGASGEKKAYLASDLDLDARLQPLARVGEAATVAARLTYQGRAVADPAMLKDVKFTATALDPASAAEQAVELRPDAASSDPAEFKGSLAFSATGGYRVRVSAESPGFQRSKLLSIAVTAASPPGPTAAAEPPAPVEAKLPSAESPAPVEAKLPPAEPPAPVEAKLPPAEPPAPVEAKLPPAEPPAPIEAKLPSAEPREPEPDGAAAPPLPAAAQPGEEAEVRRSALFKLVLTNLALFGLLGIGGGVWWWRSRRKADPRGPARSETSRKRRPTGRPGA
jgi:hypothetical protein